MGMSINENNIFIVTEYMERGSLKDLLRTSTITWSLRMKMLIDIASVIVMPRGDDPGNAISARVKTDRHSQGSQE